MDQQSSVSVIGSDVTVKGNLSGDEDLVLQGRVEGDVVLSKHLTVEESAAVEGNVEAAELVLRGKVEGEIRVTGELVLAATSQVVGDITAPRISVQDGARVNGSITMEVQLPDGVLQ